MILALPVATAQIIPQGRGLGMAPGKGHTHFRLPPGMC